ncbi:hypothetical protein DYB32_008940 [Aphanomyces invadans]|uniref:Uncharacterized protein n=1 Tax=Aphanomyces invadans TaxID=157072 RepID=A0A3R6VFY3_9STRA|nr:hypothetical protein DYB32_008940 [Aphanomyces invadans]
MKALERDNQEWILFGEGKDVVDLIVKAVRPSMLQSAVKKQIQLQRNKPLRMDVFSLRSLAADVRSRLPNRVLLSRRLRLSVAITTTCGPLLLRGLPVWIDDEADDDVALIISGPLMESLGFSTDALLVYVRSLKPE